jgi:hypothetical protein
MGFAERTPIFFARNRPRSVEEVLTLLNNKVQV